MEQAVRALQETDRITQVPVRTALREQWLAQGIERVIYRIFRGDRRVRIYARATLRRSGRVVTVTDELPLEVIYGGVSGDGWSCSHAGGALTCTRPYLAPGIAPSIAITVTEPSVSCRITNTATISGHKVDLDPSDNVTSAAMLIRAYQYIYLPLVLW